MNIRARAAARLVGLGLLLGCLCVAVTTNAWAHGGNFRVGDPNGGPPAGGPPVVGPPVPGVPVVTPPSRGRYPRSNPAPWNPGDWTTWWALNRESLLPLCGEHGPRPVITPGESPVWRVGDAGAGARGLDREDPIRERQRDLVLPFLLRLADPNAREKEPLVAVALLALARMTTDSAPIALLEHWAKDRRASLEVRESAVLGLGLLRRTAADEQMRLHRVLRNRDLLLGLFDDEREPTRVRAFAMIALGLLADQRYGESAIEQGGTLVTRAIWQRVPRRYRSGELPAALFTALSMQPPQGVPSTILQKLERIALGKPTMSRTWDARERSHALAALARLGGDDVVDLLLSVLGNTRHDEVLHAAAAIGLAHRAPSMNTARRARATLSIRRRVDRDRHAAVRGLSMLTLGHLLRADLQAGSMVVLKSTDVADFLVREAKKGPTQSRPYAAVALGLSAHGVEALTRDTLEYLTRVRETMAWGLKWARGVDDVVAAYAVGAGLSQAEQALPLLTEILEDSNRGPRLRGDAALALGQIGRSTSRVEGLLLGCARERISPYVHLQAVRSLSILGSDRATEEILSQFQGKPTRGALVAVAQALGRLRDPEATARLIAMGMNPRAGLYVRVASVMALGLLYDRESRPSRTLLTTNSNYPAMTWALAQAFNIV